MPLYESCYEFEGAQLMGKPATKMRERFESKGLSIGEDIHEPPDHLAIELEYLYFLLEKGWSQKDEAVAAEALSFASESMLPWVTEFKMKLAGEKECPFYSLISSVLVAILNHIGEFGGLEPQTES